ncbi:MAG: DUF1127 domain-containing protein [Burkholderiaceae bacterium]
MAINTSTLFGPLHTGARIFRSLGQWVARLTLAEQVAEERRQLASLDDALLRDIGIDRATAHHESTRGFWDLPVNRD